MADLNSPVLGSPSPVSDYRTGSRWRRWGAGLFIMGSLVVVVWMGIRTLPKPPPVEPTGSGGSAGDAGADFVAPVRAPPASPTPAAAVVPTPSPSAGSGIRLPGAGAGARPVPIAAFQAPLDQPVKGSAGSSGQDASGIAAGGGDALGDRLQAGADQDTSVATRLPNRNLFITMGTPIGCITEQP